MDIDLVDSELRAGVRRFPSFLPFHSRRLQPVLQFLARLTARTKTVDGVRTKDIDVGNARVRVYRPAVVDAGKAGMLWIHGGGLVIGTINMDNLRCSLYARDLGIVVASVEYRLAPQNPFPAALEDCYAAWEWFQGAAAGLGVDPTRIVVAGASAGGGLAASLAQRIHDCGGTQPIAQSLIYPMLDDRTATRRDLDSVKHFVWSSSDNRGGWASYLGQAPGAESLPEYAAPSRRDDLSGLPPTWIGVGDLDLFYEENQDYADRLLAAGVDCVLDVVPGAPHEFPLVAPGAPISQAFLARNTDWLRDQLDIARRT